MANSAVHLVLEVHEVLLGKKFVFRLAVVRVIDTAIHRTYCSTLRLVMETYALRTFFMSDVINIHVDWLIGKVSRDVFAVEGLDHAFQ
jgi:hypothetical protein